ncbi:MAG: diguanylate cyclase [Gammaproteobacteria bacterium]|nr:diguanylate cyclase [Gammaproteobacteria bacterium]
MSKITDIPYLSLIYAGALAAGVTAVLVFFSWHTGMLITDPVAFAGFIVFGIAIASYGFPAPHVGYVSLDRVVQFASILVFGALQAAWIVGIAALIAPLLAWDRVRGSGLRLTLVRCLHNAGMLALVVLITGYLYQFFGGSVPLLRLDPHDLLLIVLLALFMQLLNMLLMAVIAWMEGYDWLHAFGIFAATVDVAAIPLAVLTALVYNRFEWPVMVLFLIVLAMIVLIVRRLADTRRVLEDKLDTLTAVNRVGRAISSSLVLDELLEMVFRECRSLMSFEIFILGLYDESAHSIDVRLHHNPKGRQPPRRQDVGVGHLGWVISHNKPAFMRNWERETGELKRILYQIGDTPQTQSLIAVPMTYRERVLGVLSVQSYSADRFDESHVSLLMNFASQVAVAIANAGLFAELERSRHELEHRVDERTRDLAAKNDELRAQTERANALAVSLRAAQRKIEIELAKSQQETRRDELTGLFNRRALDELLVKEVNRAQRYQRSLAVVMADIDHFKSVNDRFSHMVGDDVLRAIANILRAACRSLDVIARYGGEEFLLCFPETSRQNAAAVCEKIRQQVESHDWSKIQPGLTVTISFGVTAAPPEYDVDTLIAAADQKLYEAKYSGRNRVCA